MIKPEDEPALEQKSAPPTERKKRALMGRGVIMALAFYAAIAFGLYLFVSIYMASNPTNAN